MIFIIYFVSRLLIMWGAVTAQNTLPYLGFFPYKELLVEFGLPSWVSAFANFDGIHYLLIAKQGYSQWEQAFFPLFPLLIRGVFLIVPHYLVAALFVSHVSLLTGLIFFQKLLREWGIKTMWPIFFLLSFPTAFFFGVVYTEGLFFMLFVLSLYFLHKKNYWLAGLCAGLSSATRLIGIFLIIPFFFHFLSDYKKSLKNFQLLAFSFQPIFIAPFLGLFSYMSYLWITTGDPLFFFNSQPLFGANRSTHLILLPQVYFRYIKILLTAAHNFQWYLSLLEMVIFSLVFVILILDLLKIIRRLSPTGTILKNATELKTTIMRLALNMFSFINLILPTLTGTFSSIPRYALFSLSFFLYLAELKSGKVKVGILAIFITLQIVLLSLFIQGYFVG